MSHPFEGWSVIGEGWDTGNDIETSELFSNLKSVAKNFAGPVGMVLVAYWAIKLLLSLGIGLLLITAEVAQINVLFTVGNVLGYLGYLIVLLVGLAQWSLFRPIQLQAFEGREFISGFGDAFRLSREALGKTIICALLWGFSIGVGSIACGIGALIPIFFFSQAPYLGATTELTPWEAMRRSYELNKAYWMPVLGAVAGSLFVMAFFQGCGGAVMGLIAGLLMQVSPGLGSLVLNLGTDIISMLGGAMILIITGGIYTTIQAAERGVPLAD